MCIHWNTRIKIIPIEKHRERKRVRENGDRNEYFPFGLLEYYNVLYRTVSWWYGFCQLRPHIHDNTMHPNAPADVKPIALLPMTDSIPPNTIIVNRSPFAYFYWYVAKKETNENEGRRAISEFLSIHHFAGWPNNWAQTNSTRQLT